jgi:hypothetical protein
VWVWCGRTRVSMRARVLVSGEARRDVPRPSSWRLRTST